MSEFNKDPIDVVVMWVNSEDPVWQNDFRYWSERERGNKDRCRIRDLGQLKYFMRSVDQYCPWVRYVWLVLYGPTQIPEWVNKECPKLKIIYHKDFIPEEYLPTFNSFVIDMNLHRIEGLSNNFIFCNDDMLFLKGLKETDCFKNDRPQFPFKYLHKGHFTSNIVPFDKTLQTNFKFIQKICGSEYTVDKVYHMPIPFNKTVYQFMWEKYGDEIRESLIDSRFRQSKNIFNWSIFFIQQIMKLADNVSISRNYLSLTDYISIPALVQTINSSHFCCINDTEQLRRHENKVKSVLIGELEKKFKNKSVFENE